MIGFADAGDRDRAREAPGSRWRCPSRERPPSCRSGARADDPGGVAEDHALRRHVGREHLAHGGWPRARSRRAGVSRRALAIGPIWSVNSTACSSVAPAPPTTSVPSSGSIATSRKPGALQDAAHAARIGEGGGPRRAGRRRGGQRDLLRGRAHRHAHPGVARQLLPTHEGDAPAGHEARAQVREGRLGSAKNITPKRLKTRSKVAGSSRVDWASAFRNADSGEAPLARRARVRARAWGSRCRSR